LNPCKPAAWATELRATLDTSVPLERIRENEIQFLT
jgi:hypothetical protein